MAFYKVLKTNWILGGNAGKWYAFKGLSKHSPSGTKADGGPFKTRSEAIKWIKEYENAQSHSA